MSNRTPSYIKGLIKIEREAVGEILAKGDDNVTEADIRELEERDGKLNALMEEYKQVEAKHERTTAERRNLQNIFAGRGGSTHDGSPEGMRKAAREARGTKASAGSVFAEAILDQGWNLRERTSVEFDLKSTLPSAETYQPRNAIGIMPAGMDKRFIYPNLNQVGIGTETSIDDFQSSSTRTVTGTVERALDAATAKAELDVTVTAVSVEVKQVAITLQEIPNSVLSSLPQAENFFGNELFFQLQKAIDTHVMAQIVAATPPNGITGADVLTQYRNAVSAMRAVGSNPDLLVLDPSDSADLDLLQDNDAKFFYSDDARTSGGYRIWDMRIIETSTGTNPPALLLDSQRIGVLYLGQVKMEADPYTHFLKNLTDIRMEASVLFFVRDANGAYTVEA